MGYKRLLRKNIIYSYFFGDYPGVVNSAGRLRRRALVIWLLRKTHFWYIFYDIIIGFQFPFFYVFFFLNKYGIYAEMIYEIIRHYKKKKFQATIKKKKKLGKSIYSRIQNRFQNPCHIAKSRTTDIGKLCFHYMFRVCKTKSFKHQISIISLSLRAESFKKK